MSKFEALFSFIEPTHEVVKILVFDCIDVTQFLIDIVPNARYDVSQIDVLCNKNIDLPKEYYDYVIISDLLKDSHDIQNVLYQINVVLKFDGCLLSMIDSRCYWNDIKRYAKVLSSAKFRELFVSNNGEIYYIKSTKYKKNVIELKRMYNPLIRRKLTNLLHRIEYNINIEENTVELALLCEKNNISKEYLDKYIHSTVIYRNNLYNNLLFYNYSKLENTYCRVRDLKKDRLYSADMAIAFIMCVNDDNWYHEAVIYIENLIVPDGYGVEIIDARNASSMCAGYNSAMERTNAKYKVYMHQDCLILNERFIFNILDIFKDNSVGCVGMIGVDPMPSNAIWWTSSDQFGRVIHSNYPEEIIELKSYIDLPLKYVEAVDGLLMATQYDIRWRDDLFTGWHFYDISMCHEMRRRGYRVVVPRQEVAWCMHCPSDKLLDSSYETYRNIYLQYVSMNE